MYGRAMVDFIFFVALGHGSTYGGKYTRKEVIQ